MLGDACPFPVYVDRKKHVYTALGMTMNTNDPGRAKKAGAYVQVNYVENLAIGELHCTGRLATPAYGLSQH